ncbi:MAG: hypothetical protein J6A41_06220 [Ruminiclostridium sp.]|nr:hypothetical protein [Ruminiclostridium sp.]
MKKILIIILPVILAGAIGVSIPFIINSGDKLVSSSVRELEGETYLIEIDTEKTESNTRCSLSVNKEHLGENNYRCRILFNEQILETFEPDYSVDYLDISVCLNGGDEIKSAYAVCDKSQGYEKIKANNGILGFSGNKGYMEIEFILSDTDPDDEMKINLNCALQGNGFNALNRIHGIEQEIII